MDWVAQVFGATLVLAVLADIFFTVLYARSGIGLLSPRLTQAVWRFFRGTGQLLPSRSRDRWLSFCGPVLLVAIVTLWISLLVCGFALIVWPALGSAIQASKGPTPETFAAALYYSGYSLSTLGTGDIVPQTSFYRMLMVFEAFTGFGALTLALTYFMSIYSALVRRSTFAMSVHHATGDTGAAAELLAGLGASGDFSGARQRLTGIARDLMDLFESHHSYPVLHYFRFAETHYAMARVALVAMDTVTLARSALDEEKYASLIRSEAMRGLWGSGMHLLTELAATHLPHDVPAPESDREQTWTARYQRAAEHLQSGGVATASDEDAGARRYVNLRREWEPYVFAFADYMAYERKEVAAE